MTKRKKWGLLITALILLTPGLLFIVFYRLTNFRTQEITREIRYQIIDIGQLDTLRFSCETIFGNRRIWVTGERNKPEWFYVTKADFEKLWPEPVSDMEGKNYTIEATFLVQPLLMTRGFSIATIKEIKRLRKTPVVSK